MGGFEGSYIGVKQDQVMYSRAAYNNQQKNNRPGCGLYSSKGFFYSRVAIFYMYLSSSH